MCVYIYIYIYIYISGSLKEFCEFFLKFCELHIFPPLDAFFSYRQGTLCRKLEVWTDMSSLLDLFFPILNEFQKMVRKKYEMYIILCWYIYISFFILTHR